jgi:hypothetical protein
LDSYCAVPNPLASWEEAQRFWHLDLGTANTRALLQELAALHLWTSLQGVSGGWFAERIARLEGANRERR